MDALVEIPNRKSVLFDPPGSRLPKTGMELPERCVHELAHSVLQDLVRRTRPTTAGRIPIPIETGSIVAPVNCSPAAPKS